MIEERNGILKMSFKTQFMLSNLYFLTFVQIFHVHVDIILRNLNSKTPLSTFFSFYTSLINLLSIYGHDNKVTKMINSVYREGHLS